MTSKYLRGALWLAASALAICLSACGGGGSGAADQQADLSGRHYLPAAVGDRWLYTAGGGSSSVVVKVIGSEAVGGQTGVVVRSDDGSGNVVLLEDAQGVKQLPTTGTDILTAAIGSVQLLRYPLTLGDTYTNVDKSLGATFDFDSDGVGDPTGVQGTVQVVELATIVTPVGTLTDCLHVRTTRVFTIELSGVKRTIVLTQIFDDWLAPGIGLVRSQQTLSAESNSDTFSREIAAYRVGNLRSESVPATATAPGITGTVALGSGTTVDILFSEDMDQDSLLGALTVVDSAGHAIAGTVGTSSRAIHFTPAAPWATGTFSARLAATATDVVGNAAAAAEWSFAIDATAPAVVGTQPLEGAVDVPLASSIVLQFSEPVLASSVNDGAIQVLYSGALLTQVSYEVAANQVTLTPQTGLVRGKAYSISIHGVTDLAGNPVVATQLHFTTDPGRFGAPVPLPAPVADMSVGTAVAIGDVNGDGRPDVVAGTLQFVGGAIGWESRLAVYLRQADGSLGAAVLVPLQSGAQALAIAIADVNGDGRKDVVVAEAGFGVQIFLQAADGSLVADQVLNGTTSRMQLADMNGDGRPDIVSFGANAIDVWLNLPGGWTLSDTVTVTTYPAARDLGVGDINGDGRPDVVFVGESMPGFAAAGILKQGADGHLASPEWIFDGNNDTAFSLVVGDADGDGRADIVLSFATGLRLVRQQADGTLAPMITLDNISFPGTPILADINGDVRADVLTVDALGALTVRLRQADGTWAAPAVYPGTFQGTPPSTAALAVGDTNGDGLPDVVAGGNRFIQRPVPMTSQSVRPVRSADPSGSLSSWLQAVLRATTPVR